MPEYPYELIGVQVTPGMPDAPLVADDLLDQAEQREAEGADPAEVAELVALAHRLLQGR